MKKGRGFPEHIMVGAKEKGKKDEVIQKSFKEARLLGEGRQEEGREDNKVVLEVNRSSRLECSRDGLISKY